MSSQPTLQKTAASPSLGLLRFRQLRRGVLWGWSVVAAILALFLLRLKLAGADPADLEGDRLARVLVTYLIVATTLGGMVGLAAPRLRGVWRSVLQGWAAAVIMYSGGAAVTWERLSPSTEDILLVLFMSSLTGPLVAILLRAWPGPTTWPVSERWP